MNFLEMYNKQALYCIFKISNDGAEHLKRNLGCLIFLGGDFNLVNSSIL